MKHIYFYRMVIYLSIIALVTILYLYWQKARDVMDELFCAIGGFVNSICNFIGASFNITSLQQTGHCVRSGQFLVIAVIVIFVLQQGIKRQES